MRVEPDQRAPAAATTAAGRSGAARQQNGFSAWSFGLQPVVLPLPQSELAETKCPPHEAHPRTTALIGVVSQRSCAATERRRPSSEIERRCSLSHTKRPTVTYRSRVDGDCATECDLRVLLKNDTNLRQTLDDMT
jgi:hypothetical protein